MADSSSSGVQEFIHSLEQGRLAPLIRGLVIAVVIVAVALAFLGWKFRGFLAPEAMDQAQVAREISRGHGWSTQFIRPLAVWQLEKNGGPLPKINFPDTYNAPLPPLVDAIAVKLSGNKMELKPGEYVAPAERYIVALSILFFLGSVWIEYLLLRRLFDARLAFWAAILTLVSDLCWQYTLTGLPQMLMLLLFNAGLYSLVRAIEAHLGIDEPTTAMTEEGAVLVRPSLASALGWSALTGVLFGLLTLSHGVAAWFFVGLLAFGGVYFRRRPAVVFVMLAAFALVCVPWLVRNERVSGNVFGVAGYSIYDSIGGTTTTRMRSSTGPMADDIPVTYFRTKIQDGIVYEVGHLAASLGDNLLALAFFVCLLHSFRRPGVNAVRNAVLVMWLFAVFGMALLGNVADPASPIGANRLGVLFLPIMLGFGLAFVLVLFSRREEALSSVARLVLFAVLFVVSGLPLLFTLLPRNGVPFQYPPYFEPGINRLNGWTKENEIIGSDMPWAVAWYADRKSLWIPDKFEQLMGLSDDAKLPGVMGGVFLTPISRNTPLFSGVLRGEYQEYQQLIFGRADQPYFPFHEGLLVMGDPAGYLFFSDTRRWDKAEKAITPASLPTAAIPAAVPAATPTAAP